MGPVLGAALGTDCLSFDVGETAQVPDLENSSSLCSVVPSARQDVAGSACQPQTAAQELKATRFCSTPDTAFLPEADSDVVRPNFRSWPGAPVPPHLQKAATERQHKLVCREVSAGDFELTSGCPDPSWVEDACRVRSQAAAFRNSGTQSLAERSVGCFVHFRGQPSAQITQSQGYAPVRPVCMLS